MILTVGNVKGGTGKSTLSVNIAIQLAAGQRSVLLVDGDEQQSSLSFTHLRNRNDYTAVALTGPTIRSQLPKLAQHYDEVIIDVGGRDSGSFRAALTISQALLVPVQPRTFDVWALENTAQLVTEALAFNTMLNCYTVLSIADSQGHDNEFARQALLEYSALHYLPTPIMRRKVYTDGLSQGKGVGEVKPKNAKAVAELHQLIATLYGDH